MVAVKGRTDRKMMLARHITQFTRIARDSHVEAGTVTSSYMTAAKSRSAGKSSAIITDSSFVVGIDRGRATQAAAITNTKLTLSFRSKRHVLRAGRMSGRTPNVNENSAEEIASPPMMAMTRPCPIGLGLGCAA